MRKLPPLSRLQRLLEVKQRDVKSNQLRLHKKRVELDLQLERLMEYRQEYVKVLMGGNCSPLQMDDTQRFLQNLEISIEETRKAIDGQAQSEQALQAIAGRLDSQQKSVERRIVVASKNTESANDSTPAASASGHPYKGGSRNR